MGWVGHALARGRLVVDGLGLLVRLPSVTGSSAPSALLGSPAGGLTGALVPLGSTSYGVPAEGRDAMRRLVGAGAVAGITLLFLPFALPAYAAAEDLDPTFGVGGKVTRDLTSKQDLPWSVAFQADGKIVAAGESGVGGPNSKFVVTRSNADGSPDTTFGVDGTLTTDFTSGEDVAYAVAIGPDGKIVAAGTAGFETFAVARYNTDGSLDTTFGGTGKVTTDFTSGEDFAFAVAVQADGKIVAGGDSGSRNPKFALTRYNTDGSLDPTFAGDGKVTTDFSSYPDDLLALAIQPDSKILAVGGNGFGDPNEDFAMARYNTDGSLDTTFGGDGKVTTSFTRHPDVAFAVRVQADGKIVVAGGAALAVRPKFALARYDTGGSLDTSFGGDGTVTTDFTPGGDDDAYSLAFQPDGKIVAAGQSGGPTNFKFALALYNTDGSLDTSFGGDGKVTTDFTDKYDGAYGVEIEADGKIVAGGPSGGGGSHTKLALARYLAT
jgi:uncharacterized delta-60 repeat protein